MGYDVSVKNRSIYSPHYKVPNFEGLTVKQRIQSYNSLLNRPYTEQEGHGRTRIALYAFDKMSADLLTILNIARDQSEYPPVEFWSQVTTNLESRFQGNLNSVLLTKSYTRHTNQAQMAFINALLTKIKDSC